LSGLLNSRYPASKQDLYGSFTIRSTSLAKNKGMVSMIIGDTWMNIKSFAELRSFLLANATIHSALHLRDSTYHADKFGANVALVIADGHRSRNHCTFLRLEPLDPEDKRHRL